MPLWASHILLAVGWCGPIFSKISAPPFKGECHEGDLKDGRMAES